MAHVRQYRLTQITLLSVILAMGVLFSGCGGSGGGGDDDDDGGGSADTSISITETFNLNSGSPLMLEAKNRSTTNGAGIGKIISASAASPQPGNGYTASTVDIVNAANNSVVTTVNFAPSLASNASAAQLAALIETQNNEVDTSASTTLRLTVSTSAIAYADQFSINGLTIVGTTISEVMADIDQLPNVTATIGSNGVITVVETDGNDLRLDLNNAAANQTITIESLVFDEDNQSTVLDTAVIGNGQPNTKATIGGLVKVTLDVPLQLANPGVGNIFGSTIPTVYEEQIGFDISDPDTFNDSASIQITDSLGNSHTLTQYFTKQDDLGGTQPNRWKLYVLIDGRNVGANDSSGNPTLAAFDLAFDSNGQIDTSATDAIVISRWVPLDSSGNPNNAATARITIGISGSTQFGGAFALTNVTVD